jgi:hypothetical protein
MKLRRKHICLFGALCIAAAGLRIHTGQGYLDPSLTGSIRLSSSKEANRTLDVKLTNRDSGRTQKYGWPLSVSGTDGTVSLHCHEWKQVTFFGVPVFGLRRNEFHRTVRVDDSIRGRDETYDYVVSWRVRSPKQTPDLTPDDARNPKRVEL